MSLPLPTLSWTQGRMAAATREIKSMLCGKPICRQLALVIACKLSAGTSWVPLTPSFEFIRFATQAAQTSLYSSLCGKKVTQGSDLAKDAKNRRRKPYKSLQKALPRPYLHGGQVTWTFLTQLPKKWSLCSASGIDSKKIQRWEGTDCFEQLLVLCPCDSY